MLIHLFEDFFAVPEVALTVAALEVLTALFVVVCTAPEVFAALFVEIFVALETAVILTALEVLTALFVVVCTTPEVAVTLAVFEVLTVLAFAIALFKFVTFPWKAVNFPFNPVISIC